MKEVATEAKSAEKSGGNAHTEPQSQRVRLRVRPLAHDSFTTLVYVCLGLLLFGEFVALFWLDLFY